VNPAKSVAGHGVDSLIAAELRHCFLHVLAADFKMINLLDAQTSFTALAESIANKAVQMNIDTKSNTEFTRKCIRGNNKLIILDHQCFQDDSVLVNAPCFFMVNNILKCLL
jgi:hypothetical protein